MHGDQRRTPRLFFRRGLHNSGSVRHEGDAHAECRAAAQHVVPALSRQCAEGPQSPSKLFDVSRGVVAFCGQQQGLCSKIEQLLAFVREAELDLGASFDPSPMLPFDPLSFRRMRCRVRDLHMALEDALAVVVQLPFLGVRDFS